MRDPREVERRRLEHIAERLRRGLSRVEAELRRYEHPSENEIVQPGPTS